MLLLNQEIKPAGCQEASRGSVLPYLGAPGPEGARAGPEGARAGPGGCEAPELLCQRCLGAHGSCVFSHNTFLFPLQPSAPFWQQLQVPRVYRTTSSCQASGQGKEGERVKEERPSDPTNPPRHLAAAFSTQKWAFLFWTVHLPTYVAVCFIYRLLVLSHIKTSWQ